MAYPKEKDSESHVEKVETHNPLSGDRDIENASDDPKALAIDNPEASLEAAVAKLSDHEGKKALRKVDMRLVPLLTFLYLVSFVDRSNSKYLTLIHLPCLIE